MTADVEQSRGRVLIVDDEAPLRRAYRRNLSNAGYAVEVAGDGEAGIARFREGGVDVVLTDISMPGFDGLELLRQIRAENADVPVVLVTGGPSVETAIQAMDHGAFKYLIKPVEPAELLEVIGRAMQLNRLAEMKRQALVLLGDLDERMGTRTELDATFDSALAKLFMLYQPIVRYSDRQVYGYEALVRSKEQTLPHPGALFGAAEKLGRVGDLGRAIRAIASAPMADVPESLFLNLHPEDLSDPALFDPASPVARMASRVVLEITERASLDAVPDARKRIGSLREMGFRIAVDDLGAGYAGLTSFVLLEPDVAKLDMAIVRDVHLMPTKQKLIRSMSDLCRDMGMELVAEGVETEDELRTLVELGCDLFQGYYFARPADPFPSINWPSQV